MHRRIFGTRDAVPLTPFRPRFAIPAWLGIILCLISACASEQTPPPNTMTPLLTATATVPCEQTQVAPAIMEIQPAEPIAGSEINVIGSGGYIQDTCDGYIEGAREFKLYLDQEPVGDLACYVNHCEGKVTLPGTLTVGTHCLSMEADACEFEFQLTAQ